MNLQLDNLTFYKCLKSDLEEISKLASVIWPSAFKEILSEDQSKFMLEWMYNIETLEKKMDNGHLFYLTKETQTNVGFVGLQPDFPEKGKLRIHKIYLSQEYHGKGIGIWMMDQVEKLAQTMSLNYLHLNVNRYNKATEFYKKGGFEILFSEDIDIGNGYFMNDFVMQKKL
ncbi:GNAT family N-acetyltransferase [Crocinitomicaceae bacterium]|nr:GNAT family N-acetyltransferase [Crocinitomicaceae bacterium]